MCSLMTISTRKPTPDTSPRMFRFIGRKFPVNRRLPGSRVFKPIFQLDKLTVSIRLVLVLAPLARDRAKIEVGRGMDPLVRPGRAMSLSVFGCCC